MSRYDDHYDDDDDCWDEEFEGEELEEERQNFARRFAAVMGTSYGISVLVHVALLVILGLIVIAAPPEPAAATILVNRTPAIERYDPDKVKDTEKRPDIPMPATEEEPVVMLEDTVEIAETPKGDPNNAANKNLQDVSFSDISGLAGGPPAGMKGRLNGIGRLVGTPSGSPPSEDAVNAALLWLKRHQSPDGSWSGDGWKNNCADGKCEGPGSDEGGSNYSAGLTGLSVLAYTGHGNSHRFGTFKLTVSKALRYLKAQQRSDGSIGYVEAGDHGGMYNHALATMALCELYGVSRDFTIKRQAQKAVRFVLKAQNPNLGWRYRPKNAKNDTSVTGWMVLALKAAKTAGLEVPEEAFLGAQRWFARATSSDGVAGYTGPGTGSGVLSGNEAYKSYPTMTAVSVVCRVFSGERLSTPQLQKGAKVIAQDLPLYRENEVNYYYWYYGTYALYQFGGPRWEKWNTAMLKALVGTQRSGGCDDGSWDAVGEWCTAGGRVYAVALNVLTLEIYYRYERQG